MDTASIKPKLQLNNSREMPVIGLGTWLVCGDLYFVYLTKYGNMTGYSLA